MKKHGNKKHFTTSEKIALAMFIFEVVKWLLELLGKILKKL